MAAIALIVDERIVAGALTPEAGAANGSFFVTLQEKTTIRTRTTRTWSSNRRLVYLEVENGLRAGYLPSLVAGGNRRNQFWICDAGGGGPTVPRRLASVTRRLTSKSGLQVSCDVRMSGGRRK